MRDASLIVVGVARLPAQPIGDCLLAARQVIAVDHPVALRVDQGGYAAFRVVFELAQHGAVRGLDVF